MSPFSSFQTSIRNVSFHCFFIICFDLILCWCRCSTIWFDSICISMSILMFDDFEFPISVLRVWCLHVNDRSGSAHFCSSNVDFDVHWLWISDIGIGNLGDSCLFQEFYIQCLNQLFMFLVYARSGSAHFLVSQLAYAMWAFIVFITWFDLIAQL